MVESSRPQPLKDSPVSYFLLFVCVCVWGGVYPDSRHFRIQGSDDWKWLTMHVWQIKIVRKLFHLCIRMLPYRTPKLRNYSINELHVLTPIGGTIPGDCIHRQICLDVAWTHHWHADVRWCYLRPKSIEECLHGMFGCRVWKIFNSLCWQSFIRFVLFDSYKAFASL